MHVVLIVFCVVLVLFCILLYFVKPNVRRPSDWVSGEFAHRGLHGQGVPENSLAAFHAAKEKGLGVELDVQFTKDGQIIVLHDKNILRMCGVDHMAADLTYEELCAYPLAGTGEIIPLLKDVLAVLENMPVICEVKPYAGKVGIPELCRQTVALFESYPGKVCFESFSPYAVRWFRKNRPEFLRGQLSASAHAGEESLKGYEAFALRNLFVNLMGRPDFVAFDFKADTFGFWLCRTFFRPLLVAWTARGDTEREAVPAFYDAVIFEMEAKEG